MKTAIIVDDEPIIRMDLEVMLSEIGFSVVDQGADGYEAIEACRKYKPDLLMIDIKMPVFDGLSAADSIVREDIAGCVILLTAFYDDNFLERAKEIGVSGYLVKPINEKMLRPAIEVAMEQSSRYRKAVSGLKKAENKLQEAKMIEQAKALIAKRDHISESEAYAEMRSLCMKKQCTIGGIAKMMIETYPEQQLVQEAKQLLMRKYHMSENAAYRKIRTISEKNGVSPETVARKIIKEIDQSGDRHE